MLGENSRHTVLVYGLEDGAVDSWVRLVRGVREEGFKV